MYVWYNLIYLPTYRLWFLWAQQENQTAAGLRKPSLPGPVPQADVTGRFRAPLCFPSLSWLPGKLPTHLLHVPVAKGREYLWSAHVKAHLSCSRGHPSRVTTISKPALKIEGWSQSRQASRMSHIQPFPGTFNKGKKLPCGRSRKRRNLKELSRVPPSAVNVSKAPVIYRIARVQRKETKSTQDGLIKAA